MTDLDLVPGQEGRVYAVANQKGGVGKTTTAINLGTALAAAGHRTLIMDLDPQGNASTGLDSPSDERGLTTYDALTGTADLASATIRTAIDGLFLTPGSVDLSGADVEFVDDPGRAHRLKTLLDAEFEGHAFRSRFDYVLIDCPPSLNLLTVNAMTASDAVIVPLQCEFFALEGLSQLLSTIQHVQKGLNPNLRIEGIVLTMHDQRNRLSSQVAEDVRANLGDIVYSTMIPRNVRLSEAPSHAMPALIYDPKCAGSKAYMELAAEVLQRTHNNRAA